MSVIQIQKIIGINDVTPTKELSYFGYPVTYFDLNSFKLASQLIVSFKPGLDYSEADGLLMVNIW